MAGRALKVYAWTGEAPRGEKNPRAPWARQARCCVLARSLRQIKDEICGHSGGPYWPGREYINGTENEREVEATRTQPGVVFWRWLDGNDEPYRSWPAVAKEKKV